MLVKLDTLKNASDEISCRVRSINRDRKEASLYLISITFFCFFDIKGGRSFSLLLAVAVFPFGRIRTQTIVNGSGQHHKLTKVH